MKAYEKAQEIMSDLLSNGDLPRAEKKLKYKQYLKHIRSAAYQGHGEAQFDLALHYEEYNYFGVNSYYNPSKMIYWTTKACENDVAAACNNLGTYYNSGIGCERDVKKAIQCYEKAIGLGDEQAVNNLKLSI